MSRYDAVIVDNFVNNKREAVRRVEKIADRPVAFYEADEAAMASIFDQHSVTAVIHFAALKAVGESVAKLTEVLSTAPVAASALAFRRRNDRPPFSGLVELVVRRRRSTTSRSALEVHQGGLY